MIYTNKVYYNNKATDYLLIYVENSIPTKIEEYQNGKLINILFSKKSI